VEVELLGVGPDWRQTDERVRQALSLAEISAESGLIEVMTLEDAVRLGFRGSPAVLVHGRDEFADESAHAGLACRVLKTPDGLRGSPTVEPRVAVLPSAA
jgi:hypothetical protein